MGRLLILVLESFYSNFIDALLHLQYLQLLLLPDELVLLSIDDLFVLLNQPRPLLDLQVVEFGHSFAGLVEIPCS